MHRIAIVTSDMEQDWASIQLLEAARSLAAGDIVDPLHFKLEVNGTPSITIGDLPVDAYDAYIMRGFNRQGEADYQYEVLELLQDRGKLVINSPASLSVAESKAQTTYCLREAGLPVPRTAVTQSLLEARDALRKLGSVVIKPLYGSHGVDMERMDAEADEGVLEDFLRRYGVVYIQEYIPNEGRDIRAFVVGDEVVAAVYRIAQEGCWKTNVAQGSTCEPYEPSLEMRELCLEAARVIGLDYTGADIIEGPDGPMVLELNGAAWWQGLSGATGRNAAEDIVRHVLRKLDSGQPARQPVRASSAGRRQPGRADCGLCTFGHEVRAATSSL